MQASSSRPTGERSLGRLGLLVCLCVLLCARVLTRQSCHVYDDAFITYRYAQNLAEGHGLVIQPGAPWEPVLGTTTPGFALWLAGWIRAGFDAVDVAWYTALVADLLSAWILLRLLAGRPLAACALAIGFAFCPEIARVSAGGMETSLLLALTLLAQQACFAGRSVAAGLATSVACSLRPEALLLLPFLSLEARRRGRLVPYLIAAGTSGIAVVATLWAYYGNPIPHSVIAKADRHASGDWLAAAERILAQAFWPRSAYLALIPFLLLGLRALRRLPQLVPLVGFGLAIVAAYLLARPHTWGWYYYISQTVWVLLIALGLHELVASRPRWMPSTQRVERMLLCGAPLLCCGLWFYASRHPDRVKERVYDPMREWARTVSLAQSSDAVLASDIGALGYYGRGRILDSEGLVWPEAVGARGSQIELIHQHQPRYLMITATAGKLLPLYADADFRARYTPLRRWSASGATELEPAPSALSMSWVQDYILYERRDQRPP